MPFNGGAQDYDWFLQRFFGEGAELAAAEPMGAKSYDLADPLASGVFASEHQLRQAYDRLVSKKNLIIQGAPGVGKTFIVRNFAYWSMGAHDDSRTQMIQFRQPYSYDDFMPGFRPDGHGGFRLPDGVFMTFCRKAREDPDQPYVFIIDEATRTRFWRAPVLRSRPQDCRPQLGFRRLLPRPPTCFFSMTSTRSR